MEAEIGGALEVAPAHGDAHAVAAAGHVLLVHAGGNQEATPGRVAQLGGVGAGGEFLDVEVHVDLIVRAGHRVRFHVHGLRLEKAQLIQAHLGAIDLLGRSPTALDLPHLPSQHFVPSERVAGEGDAAHVGALARLHHEPHVHRAVFLHFRNAGSAGEGVSRIAKSSGDAFFRGGYQGAVEDLPGFHQKQSLHLFRGDVRKLADQLHFVHRVRIAFAHVDGDVHLLLVRRNAHLHGTRIELHVAAVLVVRLDLLQISLQLFAGVLVLAANEGKQRWMLEFEFRQQFRVRENGGADEVDVAYAGALALVDVDLHVHTVAGQFLHARFDEGAVAALGEIGAGEFRADSFQRGLFENLAFAQAGLGEALQQVFAFDRLVAVELDGFDGRPFFQAHDQGVRVPQQGDVVEEAGLEQRPRERLQIGAVQRVADAGRQQVEHGAGGDALQALQLDVRQREGLRGAGQGGGDVRVLGQRRRGPEAGGQCRRSDVFGCVHRFRL